MSVQPFVFQQLNEKTLADTFKFEADCGEIWNILSINDLIK